MVNSDNNYAKYQPQMEYPKEDMSKPRQYKYNMNNAGDIRRYADDMEKYEKIHEKHMKELKLWRDEQGRGIQLFKEDLMKEDIDDGIPVEALEEAWRIAYDRGTGFYDWEVEYDELANIARLAVKK